MLVSRLACYWSLLPLASVLSSCLIQAAPTFAYLIEPPQTVPSALYISPSLKIDSKNRAIVREKRSREWGEKRQEDIGIHLPILESIICCEGSVWASTVQLLALRGE